MNEELNRKISALRDELSTTSFNSESDRQHLQGLLAEIEKLEVKEKEGHISVSDSIKDSVARFETQHPRATAILNDIMVTLSNMGI